MNWLQNNRNQTRISNTINAHIFNFYVQHRQYNWLTLLIKKSMSTQTLLGSIKFHFIFSHSKAKLRTFSTEWHRNVSLILLLRVDSIGNLTRVGQWSVKSLFDIIYLPSIQIYLPSNLTQYKSIYDLGATERLASHQGEILLALLGWATNVVKAYL